VAVSVRDPGQPISHRAALLRSALPRPTAGRGQRLALLYAPACLLLAAVAAAAWLTGIPPARFTLDPAVLAETHPFLGAVSNVGILAWTAGASIALFTAWLLRGRTGDRRHSQFLFAAGLLTTWLMLDDLFMLHEWFFPLVLGIPQVLVLACYAMAAGAFLLHFRTTIALHGRVLLGLAIGFFGVSVLLDQLPNAWFRAWGWLYFLEDGSKLLGIVSWSGYFAQIAASAVAPAPGYTQPCRPGS